MRFDNHFQQEFTKTFKLIVSNNYFMGTKMSWMIILFQQMRWVIMKFGNMSRRKSLVYSLPVPFASVADLAQWRVYVFILLVYKLFPHVAICLQEKYPCFIFSWVGLRCYNKLMGLQLHQATNLVPFTNLRQRCCFRPPFPDIFARLKSHDSLSSF